MERNSVVGDTKAKWNLVVTDTKMEWNFNQEKNLIRLFLDFFFINAIWIYGQQIENHATPPFKCELLLYSHANCVKLQV